MSTAMRCEGGGKGRTHVNPFRAVVHHSLDLAREVPKVGREHGGGDDCAGSRHRRSARRYGPRLSELPLFVIANMVLFPLLLARAAL